MARILGGLESGRPMTGERGRKSMTGKERTLTALSVLQPDRVPLYIHAINEAPIIGIGRHLTDGLPAPKEFHEMNDQEKAKLLDTLFLIHEEFGVDGFTAFEIGHEVEIDPSHVQDDWGVVYTRNPHGISPGDAWAARGFQPPGTEARTPSASRPGPGALQG
jgi:hypothetical protein